MNDNSSVINIYILLCNKQPTFTTCFCLNLSTNACHLLACLLILSGILTDFIAA